MNLNYKNIYNNLIKLTRNKSLYLNLKKMNHFQIELFFYYYTYPFLLKYTKKKHQKKNCKKLTTIYSDK